MTGYIPETGDVVWLQFNPQAGHEQAGHEQAGHEQAGHRAALVLSPARYNASWDMMICCPMTTKIKAYPFEVVVSRDPPNVVLSDQIKNLDWRARGAVHKSRVTPEVLAEVRAKIKSLLQL